MKTLILTSIILLTSCSQRESYLKKQLPVGVTEVKEYYQKLSLTGDSINLLKAKATKRDYEKIAKKLKATQKYSDYLKEKDFPTTQKPIKNPPKWWDEPMESNDFYYVEDFSKEYRLRVTWKDGWVYVAVKTW